MKKMLIICSMSLISSGFTKQLECYQEIEKAIKSGDSIIVVTDFSKCSTPMPVYGQFVPSAIMLANNSIIFSDNHFTTNNPQSKGKPANEYVTYNIHNNNVEIDTQLISLPDYNIQYFGTNTCLLNQAVKLYVAK